MTRDRSTHRGQALVEFALVFPVAIVLLLVLFDFGRVILQSNSLTNAAREGARFAIVHQNHDMIVQRVQDMMFMGEVTNTADPDFLQYRKQNADGTLGAVCPDVTVGCVAVVHAESEWAAIAPGFNFLGQIQLEARSELPVEFVCPNPDIPAFSSDNDCLRQP